MTLWPRFHTQVFLASLQRRVKAISDKLVGIKVRRQQIDGLIASWSSTALVSVRTTPIDLVQQLLSGPVASGPDRTSTVASSVTHSVFGDEGGSHATAPQGMMPCPFHPCCPPRF